MPTLVALCLLPLCSPAQRPFAPAAPTLPPTFDELNASVIADEVAASATIAGEVAATTTIAGEVPGGGILGTPSPGEEATSIPVNLDFLEAGGSAPHLEPQRPIAGFDGQPLSQTSPALNARCQNAVADTLARHASDEPPLLYIDPLAGVRVAPINGTDVRIVYLIGVGNRPHAHLVVSRLLYALYSPTHLFLLHLDVKAVAAAADACYALQRSHPNVHVLGARRLVQWGMFSMVATALDAIQSVVASGLSFDFFINLSDADLSLRTDVEVRAFLTRMRGRSLINVHEGGGSALTDATVHDPSVQGVQLAPETSSPLRPLVLLPLSLTSPWFEPRREKRFINGHTIIECGGYGFVVVNHTHQSFPLTHSCCIGRSGPAAFAQLPLDPHPLLTTHTVYTGSQWSVR